MNNKAIITFSIGALLLLVAAGRLAPRPSTTIVLTESNTASLALPITPETSKALQEQLMALDMSVDRTPIYLTLNSPGGSIDDGLKIVATAQGLHRKVHTISIFSASMSFILSQLLDARYVLPNGTMMSHPATVSGLGGTVPGTFRTRSNSVIDTLFNLNSIIAVRAGLDPQEYEKLISAELWMQGQDTINKGFADEVVSVSCDKTLQGPGEPKKLDMGLFTVNVVFHKCPLITDPLEAKVDGQAATAKELRDALSTVGGSRIESK